MQCMRAGVLQLACQGAITALQTPSMRLMYLLVVLCVFPAAWAPWHPAVARRRTQQRLQQQQQQDTAVMLLSF